MMTIITECPFCGATDEIEVDFDAIIEYQMGATAQQAFPRMSATDREKLISGMCEECQAKVFA